MLELSPAVVAATIDHTILKPAAVREDVERVCREAVTHGFAGVCVAGSWLSVVAEATRGADVLSVAVAGFPLGTATTKAKAWEIAELARLGADEIDTVIHLGHLKAGDHDAVAADLREVIAAAGGVPVKVILETGLLTTDETRLAAELAVGAWAAYVKTATGFLGPGATVEAVALLRQTVGPDIGVKASGGIKTLADARAMLTAGATRIGASASVAIVEGA